MNFFKIMTICLQLGLTMPLVGVNETRAIELVQEILRIEDLLEVECLSGGLSGAEVIKVSTPEKSYVVRFWNMQWAEYYPQDLACQLIASDAGYGPKVYYSNAVEGVTIMDYHHPEPLPETRIKLRALVDLLKKMHTGPAVPRGIEGMTYLDFLLDETPESDFVDREALRSIKNAVYTETQPDALLVPCHRDLHHGNLLYTQEGFFAIDFTWGSMDDPYADLANIAVFNCNGLEEEKYLLHLYLGHPPSAKEVARLGMMKLPVKLFYALEFLSIARTMPASVTDQEPRSYKDFGTHGCAALNKEDFLSFAHTMLCEVMQDSPDWL